METTQHTLLALDARLPLLVGATVQDLRTVDTKIQRTTNGMAIATDVVATIFLPESTPVCDPLPIADQLRNHTAKTMGKTLPGLR